MEKIDTENISYTLTNWYIYIYIYIYMYIYIFATEPMKAHVESIVITLVILNFGTSCR